MSNSASLIAYSCAFALTYRKIIHHVILDATTIILRTYLHRKMGIFDNIGDKLSGVFNTVKNGAGEVIGKLSGVFAGAGDIVKTGITSGSSVINTGITTIGDVFKSGQNTLTVLGSKGIDTITNVGGNMVGLGNNLIGTAGSTIQSLGSSLALPLVIAGVGVLVLVLVLKSK
jgi:hypothetical protein